MQTPEAPLCTKCSFNKASRNLHTSTNTCKHFITIHQLFVAPSPTPSNVPSSNLKMAMLLDLSNELLLQILNSVTPLAIVNSATSCKRIYTLAQDDLALHRQRIAKYQTVTLWGCPSHQDKPHPILFLRDVCADWKVAYYARSLVIECCGVNHYKWFSSLLDNTQRACIVQDVAIIKSVFPEITIPVSQMLRKAFQWDEAKVTTVLKTTAAGVRGGILGLLMLSLPAIRSITFKDYVWSDGLWIK